MRALTTFIFRILGVKSPPIAAETAPVPAEKLSTITLHDPVPAGPFKDGLDAYSCGDYATAGKRKFEARTTGVGG